MKKYATTLLYSALVATTSLLPLPAASADAEQGKAAMREREARGPGFTPPGHGGTPPGQNGNNNGNGNGNNGAPETPAPELTPNDAQICGVSRSEIDGPEGQAGKSHVAHVNFDAIVADTGEASEDDAWARMMYFWIGSELSFVINAHKLEPGSEWTLVAMVEGDAGPEGICLGSGKANGGGQLSINDSIDPGSNIPPDFNPFPEEGEEQPDDVIVQLVPSDSIDCDTGLPGDPLPLDAIVLESEFGIRFVDVDEVVCPEEPNPTAADLSINKSHTGNFAQGQVGATYTIAVSNSATAATAGTVTVVDMLPAGLTATTLTGTGWTCVLGTLTCTRDDVLAVSSSYPPITLTVTVAGDAPALVTNTATVSGGGDASAGNNSDSDPTTVGPAAGPVANLGITKTHTGNFTQGQVGATYTITVSNDATAATSGIVTVTDTLPAGLTATGLLNAGWSCASLPTISCTRNDVLAPSSSYGPITLTVNVAADAPAEVTNVATVSGGGDTTPANNTANDVTTIEPTAAAVANLGITKTHTGNFTQGQIGATYTITVSNDATAATAGTVTVTDTLPAGLTATGLLNPGWSCDPLPTISCTRNDVLAVSSSYPAITLTVNVDDDAAAEVTNVAAVSGGGDNTPGNNTANDVTTIVPAAP